MLNLGHIDQSTHMSIFSGLDAKNLIYSVPKPFQSLENVPELSNKFLGTAESILNDFLEKKFLVKKNFFNRFLTMLRLGPNHAIFGGFEKKISLLRKKCAKMRWEVLGPNFLGMSRKMLAWKALKSAWLDFAYFLRSDPSKRGHLRPGKCCFRGVLLNIHGTLHLWSDKVFNSLGMHFWLPNTSRK